MPKKPPEFKDVPFGQIKLWGKNPRQIEPDKLQALARSIEKYSLFQNLTCWIEDGEYVTGGGNMRWRAMKEILGWPPDKLVHISVNYPESEAEKLELSFLDNQSFGFYNELEVASLIRPHAEEMDLDFLSIESRSPVALRTILDDWEEDEGMVPVLDIYDGSAPMGNRVPISGDWTVVGVGNYCGIVPRTMAEPVVELLRRKFGEARQGRTKAGEMICDMVRRALEPEVGPAPPAGGKEDMTERRRAEKQARREAEAKELERIKAKRAAKKDAKNREKGKRSSGRA